MTDAAQSQMPDGNAPHTGGAGRPGPALAWLWRWSRELVLIVGVALVLSLIVKTWLLQAFYIPSQSMENTLQVGDRVVVSKLTPNPVKLQRGEVVVFDDPNHWLPEEPPVRRGPVGAVVHDALLFVGVLPDDANNHLIKRVIGLPGDRVACCTKAGMVTVNGKPVSEPYVKAGDRPSELKFSVTVPAGRLWVMGDHRADSGDSRYHDDGSGRSGSVPQSVVVGRALGVVWPVPHLTWLGQGGSASAAVPRSQ